MAPPPGLFSTITGWPKLSDNFCPKTRAMMSLPPPAAKPTMMWIGRVGYFAGSSCAEAGAPATTSSKHAPIRYLAKLFIEFPQCCRNLEPRDVNMQHRGLAVIQRGEAAVDGGDEIIRLGDAFAIRAERAPDSGKIPGLALTARGQP